MNKPIPAEVVSAFNAYGHAFRIEDAVAFRNEPSRCWCAILFRNGEELTAVTFERDAEGEWELADEGVGPFESVEVFLKERLVSRL